MSNQTKKILVMALTLLALFALACGGSGRTGDTGHDSTGGSADVVTNHVLPA